MGKIYTRTGDAGRTGLWGGGRVSKAHPRVRAYGDIDEANSALGAALAALPASRGLAFLREAGARVQAELFVVGALLASPAGRKLSAPFDRGLPSSAAARLEAEIDRMDRGLSPLKTFILPGGSPAGALLHLARTVCRRAEREVVALEGRDAAPAGVVVYLNRLSDWLFTAARWTNARVGRVETPWLGLGK